MIEIKGDLFKPTGDVRAIVIPVNGTIKKDGKNVMGRGVAKELYDRWPLVPKVWGEMLAKRGNKLWWCQYGYWPSEETINQYHTACVFFPVKYNWWEKADLALIKQSAKILLTITDHEFARYNPRVKNVVWLPRVGCGNGKLNWESQVKPLLAGILDNRFVVVNKED